MIFWKAVTLKRQGRLEEAISLDKRAAELDPRNVGMRVEIAITYNFLRRYAEAEAYLDSVLALAPDLLHINIWKHELSLQQAGNTGPLRSALATIPDGLDQAY